MISAIFLEISKKVFTKLQRIVMALWFCICELISDKKTRYLVITRRRLCWTATNIIPINVHSGTESRVKGVTSIGIARGFILDPNCA